MTQWFRSKPKLVQAKQWYPGSPVFNVAEEHSYDIHGDIIGKVCFVTMVSGQRLCVLPGDWVIAEPDGIHHYTCKNEIFRALYEEVGEQFAQCLGDK